MSVLDCVTKLRFAINRFKDNYKLAAADLDIARQHALFLQEEIRALEPTKTTDCRPVSKTGKEPRDLDNVAEAVHPVLEEASFAKAISTAHELLSTIEASFPLRSESHIWRWKVRWIMKDKQVLAPLEEQLNFTESTLYGIQSDPLITKPTKLLPWILRFDRKGFSAQTLAVPKDKGDRYQAAVHL
ncbi:MAG: hypothetical protein Q9221_001096 [Calogaya cf. arnoldii]